MRGVDELRRLLHRIDGRGYPAYKELRGRFALGAGEEGGVELEVDHVQGDPFASLSRMRLRVPLAEAGWPAELHDGPRRRVAFEDWIARNVRRALTARPTRSAGSGGSGRVEIDAGGQTILERSAVSVGARSLEACLGVGLPAAGRRILGRAAAELLADDLLDVADEALQATASAIDAARTHVETAENHGALQDQLAERGLVAFVADGAVLPRASGASDRPLRDAVPFTSPPELRVELSLPNAPHTVAGMGVPVGVTLIVGGGYHGKSTLLRALERGVHPSMPGDGREQVATLPLAAKVRAEDGRRVVGCDLSGFIGELPGGRSTSAFETDDASGSTSQAANIVEAIEAGSRTLLLDEDSSATNFMVRDARMQQLVDGAFEPITPFVDRVRELFEAQGVSTVLVMGGSGDYFDAADTVIEMRSFQPRDVSQRAREIAAAQPTARAVEVKGPLPPIARRVPDPRSIDARKGRRQKIDVRDLDGIGFGTERIDLRAVEQLVDPSQLRAIGQLLVLAADALLGEDTTIPELLDALDARLDDDGIASIDRPGARLARPRRIEIAAALGRLRTLRLRDA